MKWCAFPADGWGHKRLSAGVCVVDLQHGEVSVIKTLETPSHHYLYNESRNLAWVPYFDDELLVISTGQEVIAYRLFVN
ncbi:MAG: hypothetical protein ACI87A_002688 [Planctomycetota bacterium]|jgi:hypothetical protein